MTKENTRAHASRAREDDVDIDIGVDVGVDVDVDANANANERANDGVARASSRSRLGSIRGAISSNARAREDEGRARASEDARANARVDGDDGARGRARGAFAPRAPSAEAKRSSASGGLDAIGKSPREGLGHRTAKARANEEEKLPGEVERLVKEARARTSGGGRGEEARAPARGVRTARDGDFARVAIGGGVASARAAADAKERASGERAKRAGGAAGTTTTTERDVVIMEDPSMMAFPTSSRAVKKEIVEAKSDSEDEAEEMEAAPAPAPAPARATRVSKAKLALLALEERSKLIQPERATTDEMFDAEDDWTDKSQYYPTVLTSASRQVAPPSVAEIVRSATGDRFMVLQLPSDLPLRKKCDGEDMEVDGVVEIGDYDDKTAAARIVRNTSELADGQLGELKIHADGSAKLYIGNAIFDVSPGTPYQHAEQIAQLDKSSGKCVIMGATGVRMVCVPDVTHLLL